MTSAPNPREPLLDPRTGLISRYWLRFLNDVFEASGGGVESSTVPAASITPASSPYTFTAETSGLLIIRGGMISKIEYGRRDVFFSDGSTAGTYYIAKGDKIRVTYEDAPIITFIKT